MCLDMKKFTFSLFLLSLALISGCGNKEEVQENEIEKVDILNTAIDLKVCDKYFELADCVIDKTSNQNWTKKMKNELRLELKTKQEERKKLPEEELARVCSGMLDLLYTSATDLEDLWCLD